GRYNKTPAKKAAKKRKLNEEVEDLKRHLEIVPDEDDDVYAPEGTPALLSTWPQQLAVATYSVSVEEVATMVCFLHCHEIKCLPRN
nr:hypothetical protein [Tanacetum cinerariifolium]